MSVGFEKSRFDVHSRISSIVTSSSVSGRGEWGIDGPDNSLGILGLGALDDIPSHRQVGVRVDLSQLAYGRLWNQK